MTTCGEAVVKLLEAYGVDTVFGIPGVHTLELYRGLSHSNLTHITPRHEQGAGFMADGYARASGKPAACFVISGPGVTNIATAMAQAKSDSVPMLVIASVVHSEKLGVPQGLLHELRDQRGLIEQCTVYNHTIRHAKELSDAFAHAVAAMQRGRPGPAYIEIPIDVLSQPADDIDLSAKPLPEICEAEPGAIDAAAALLRSAMNPIVLLGGGAIRARDEIVSLIDKIGAPALNTTNAKGVFPRSHPLRVGGSPSDKALQEAIATSDVVLAVGTEYAETDYDFFFQGNKKPAGTVIRIDIDQVQLETNVKADVAVLGDATRSLAQLCAALDDFVLDSARGRRGLKRATELRSHVTEEADPVYRAFFSTIDVALPGAIITADSTQPAYHAVLQWERATPRTFFTSATGFGTLGFGLPAAIGAKVSQPERPVICLTGDGGLQFTLAELAAAAEASVPIIVLLWNNYGYGEIEASMIRAGVEPVGVRHAQLDFVAIAQALNCQGHRAETFDDLSDLLMDAKSAQGPVLIELREEDFVTAEHPSPEEQ